MNFHLRTHISETTTPKKVDFSVKQFRLNINKNGFRGPEIRVKTQTLGVLRQDYDIPGAQVGCTNLINCVFLLQNVH
jgi:hypothetical protein